MLAKQIAGPGTTLADQIAVMGMPPMSTTRWMNQGDLYDAAHAEAQNMGDAAFDTSQLGAMLISRETKMVVFRHEDKYAGHGIYLDGQDSRDRMPTRPSIDIVRCLVVPEYRRQGIGGAWIDYVKRQAGAKKERPVVRCLLDSRELAAHLFAKAMGFSACQVVENLSTGQELYLFTFEPDEPTKKPAWRAKGTTADFKAAICV